MHLIQNIIYNSPLLQIGTFRCPIWYPNFRDTGPIEGYLLVFPRTSVAIIHEGREPIVADPNVVMLYNKGQLYRRDKLSERGDLCDWFSFSRAVVVEAIRRFDPSVCDHPDRPFKFSHTPSDPCSYLQQRLVVRHILETDQPDSLYVEETMLSLLDRIIERAYKGSDHSLSSRQDTVRCHAELVHATRAILATSFRESVTLEELAAKVYTSPHHLCRLFRQYTGSTIHNYLNQLRLRTSLEYVAQREISLTTVGIELGYSSHSHFTQTFRRIFGTAPSTLRAALSSQRIEEMSKILTV